MLAEQTRDEVFEASVRAQLELIEAALLKAAEADSDMVTEAAQHIIAAGGKRFRPLLVVLGSHIGPHADADDVVKAAVVVELTHVASLYHDDVMDEARIRRGSASANSRWGNTVAILVGDLLFARASDIVCRSWSGVRAAPGAYLLPARAGSDRRNRWTQRYGSARSLSAGRG